MNLDVNASPLSPLVDGLARKWGWVMFRGVAAIIFGLLTLFRPGVSLAALVLLFGAFVFVEGVFNVVAAFHPRGGQHWWALLLEGLVSIAAGLITWFAPGLTAIALLYLIAGWAIVTGVLEIVAAVRLRKVISNEGWLIFGGILSVLFGVALCIYPGAGALAVVLWIGVYALLFGALLVGLAFKLRGRLHGHQPPHPIQPRPAPAS